MSKLINVINLEKVYSDGTKALRGVSLTIEKGEFVAIMGPSGSGKSTLLHMLGFLDEPTGGEYYLDDREMNEYSKEEIANVRNEKMGFVFQSFNLLARTSVLENIKLPLIYSDVPKSQWNELAEKAAKGVGLLHRLEFEPHKLSGGERQRVAIARALINNPKIIFADEPTGNLDTQSGKNIMKILEDLNNQGRTVILITHEKETARFAKRAIHLRDGKIEKDETIKNRRHATDDGSIK